MENVGQYITKYVKGKVPKQLVEIPSTETLPYLSPDYLRGKANPEFYAAPDDKIVLVEDGEVIVLWDGSNAGEIFISKKGILGSTMVKLEFDEEQIFKPYFSYSFQYLEYFLKAKTAGSGIPHADKGVIKKLNFFKPPKPEQTAIATILSKVDEAIAATQNSIKAAEKLKKALMQNLLTGKLKPDGSWRTEDDFYEDEKFGKVPKGWEVKKLGQLGSFMNGVNFSNSQLGKGYPFINLKDIYNNKIIDCSKLDKVEINKLNGLELFKGDIVFVRSSVKPSGIGWSALFNGNTETTIFCGFVIKYTFDQSIIKPEYLIELLLSEPIRNKIIALGQVVANTNINQRALKGLSIFFPKSIDEQKEIYSKLNSIDDEILDKQTKIQTLQRLKKSLMQNLLTGKVRLPQEFIAQFEEVEEIIKS